jgi:hypothetical protein
MSIVLRQAQRTHDEIAAAREALNEGFRKYKKAGQIAADPEFVYFAGELIRQLAQDQFNLTDPTPLFFDRITGPGLGNRMRFEEFVNTAKVVERSLGNKPMAYTPHKKFYPISLQDFDVNFAFELEQILTGQMTADVWVDFMAEAVSRYYVQAGFDCVETATPIGTLDAYGRAVRTQVSTTLTDTALDAALRRIGDVSSDIVIAGRYYTLFPMTGFSGWSDESKEEIRRVGILGSYKGARVVVLRDSYNPFFGEQAVRSDRIYLVGAEKGGVLAEEDMSALNYQVVDQEEQHFRVGAKLRSTFKIFKPWRYHTIEIT